MHFGNVLNLALLRRIKKRKLQMRNVQLGAFHRLQLATLLASRLRILGTEVLACLKSTRLIKAMAWAAPIKCLLQNSRHKGVFQVLKLYWIQKSDHSDQCCIHHRLEKGSKHSNVQKSPTPGLFDMLMPGFQPGPAVTPKWTDAGDSYLPGTITRMKKRQQLPSSKY